MAKKLKIKSPLYVGGKVFIRSVTHFYTGEILAVDKQTVVLKDAAWIADTGRFSDAMKTGNFNEVEPYAADQLVSVERGGIVDVCTWPHALPKVQR